MKRVMFWVMVWGILMVGLAAGPDLWAAPGQNPARQTVPTRTPQLSPTKPLPSPTQPPPSPTQPLPSPTQPLPSSTQPPPTPTFLPSDARPEPTLTTMMESNTPTVGMPEPLLPPAGGRSIRLQFSFALMTLALLILAAGKWRVQ